MKPIYRPEIDGLRAIAVLAVLIYHFEKFFLENSLLPGGFLGVDIFFVISGYLISSIILRELSLKNRFSILNFYQRRIRRIIPPLLFVIIISILFAYIYFLPKDLIDFVNSILSSLAFVSNLYFYFTEIIYGNEISLFKPLMHTWSLSVEEQFYLFFPLFIIFFYRYFNNYFLSLIFCSFIISIIFSQYMNENSRLINFFLLPSRAWELLAGTLLSILEIKKNIKSQSLINKNLMITVGIILISISFLIFENELSHPSIFTLAPVLGSCLIIWFSKNNLFLKKILSSKILVFIGLISYSLYLWHYPVFVFAKYINLFEDNIIGPFFLFVLIFLLSIFSYFIIEKPFRDKKNNFKFVSLVICFMIAAILIFCTFVNLKNGKIKKYPNLINNLYENLDYRNFSQEGEYCHNRLGNNNFCKFNFNEIEKSDIILLGDSIVDSLLASLVDKTKKSNYKITHMSYSGGLYIPDYISINELSNKPVSNPLQHDYRKRKLEKFPLNSYIVVSGNYLYYLQKKLIIDKDNFVLTKNLKIKYVNKNNQNLDYEDRIFQFMNSFKNSLIELSRNFKVILVYPLPSPPTNLSRHIKNNFFKGLLNDEDYFKKDPINYEKKKYLKVNEKMINLFDEISSSNSNIFKIETKDLFCPKDQCIFYNNNEVYFFDDVHLSYKGSEKVNELILKKINEIENNNLN